MSLSRIVLRLARNPGTEFAEGDDHRGYTLHAPLNADGKIDGAAFAALKTKATVHHFTPDGEPRDGHLAHRGAVWFVDYGDDDATDEPLFRLGEHRFVVGEYVSITDEDGRLLTYKVTEVSPVA